MEFRTLKTFQLVATYLNQTKAAEILGYTQPAITLQIRSLEQEIGHQLFHRVGKKTYLTPAGKVLKQYADSIMDKMAEMENTLASLNGPYGKLVIAAPDYYWTHFLSVLIHSYVNQYSNVKLKLISCSSTEAIRMLTTNEADIAVVAGVYSNNNLESIKLDEEDLLLVVGKDVFDKNENDILGICQSYPLFYDNNILGTYENNPIFYKESNQLDGLYDRCMLEIPQMPVSVIESNSEEATKKAVLNGTGVGIISKELIKDELERGEIVTLHHFQQHLETYLVTLKERNTDITLRSFTQMVIEGWADISNSYV